MASYNKGNQHAKKLTTPELKKMAYESYCSHIAKGKPQKSWYFEHPELTLTYKGMENYIKQSPDEFPPLNKEVAYSKNFEVWFEKGEAMMESQEKCQPAIYQMIMRNIHGWDKESVEEKVDREKQEKTMLETLVSELRKKPE